MTESILVVDDDIDVRETVRELLEYEGYSVALCENGRVALDLLRSGDRPSLILLDLMMPETTGWQFREEQLRDDELRQIPVVVMTATPEGKRKAITASEVMSKPIGLDDLVGVVRRHSR